MGTVPPVPPGLAWPRASLYPPCLQLCSGSPGAPGPPGEPFISRYGSAITIHWSSGDPGQGPITRYVIEARPSGTAALLCFHPHLVTGGALASGERETEAGSADFPQAAWQAGLGIRTWVPGVLATCWSMRTTLTGADGKGLASHGAAPIDAAAFMAMEVPTLPQTGKGLRGVPRLSQNGRALLLCRWGRRDWQPGLPIPAAGSLQARPRSLLQPRVKDFSLPQRPQLRQPHRWLTGVGTAPRVVGQRLGGKPLTPVSPRGCGDALGLRWQGVPRELPCPWPGQAIDQPSASLRLFNDAAASEVGACGGREGWADGEEGTCSWMEGDQPLALGGPAEPVCVPPLPGPFLSSR